jgi:hypothetical protein
LTHTLPLHVTDDAADQIRVAAHWWYEHRSETRSRLTEELEGAFRLLTFQPLAGCLVPDSRIPGLRRILLRNTQHHLYYRIDQSLGAVVVLAFWSTRRGSQPDL